MLDLKIGESYFVRCELKRIGTTSHNGVTVVFVKALDARGNQEFWIDSAYLNEATQTEREVQAVKPLSAERAEATAPRCKQCNNRTTKMSLQHGGLCSQCRRKAKRRKQ